VFKYRPLSQFLDFRLERAYMCLALVHQSLEVLDMLFIGLVYVTWVLSSFFACVARLFVARNMNEMTKERQRGMSVR
jgi:hypothetical protein